MAKGFSKNNPLNNLSGNAPAAKTSVVNIPDKELKPAVEPKKQPESKKHRKVGRPKTKTEETKTINIAVPVSVLEKLETVKVCYSNNLTLYINKLIEKDIEANFANYEHISDSLNNFK